LHNPPKGRFEMIRRSRGKLQIGGKQPTEAGKHVEKAEEK